MATDGLYAERGREQHDGQAGHAVLHDSNRGEDPLGLPYQEAQPLLLCWTLPESGAKLEPGPRLQCEARRAVIFASCWWFHARAFTSLACKTNA